jgi:hypothetical protein
LLNMASKRGRPDAKPTDEAVRALLDRYQCPVPFHVVRTRLLGAIVSPVAEVSPIAMVKGLWGGELPAFDRLDAVNELLEVLVMGLWNRLTRHQKRNEPFRLVRIVVPQTVDGLAKIAVTRREEIDGFVDGIFGPEEGIDLPERGYHALGELGEIRAMLAGLCELAHRRDNGVSGEDVTELLANIHQLTKITEHELHEAVLSCVRARRQMSHALPVTKPIFH